MSSSSLASPAPPIVRYHTTVSNPHVKTTSHIVFDVSTKTIRYPPGTTPPASRSSSSRPRTPSSSDIVASDVDHDAESIPGVTTELTVVERRYSDFEWLHSILSRTLPFLLTPPIPPKEAHKLLTSKFDAVFVEKRARHLNAFLARVAQHPLLSRSPAFHAFLYADEVAIRRAVDLKLHLNPCYSQSLLSLPRFRKAGQTLTYELPQAPSDATDAASVTATSASALPGGVSVFSDDPITAALAESIATATVARGGGSPALLTSSGSSTTSIPGSTATYDPVTALFDLPLLWRVLATAGLVSTEAAEAAESEPVPRNPFLGTPAPATLAAAAAAAEASAGPPGGSPLSSAVASSAAAANAAINMLSGVFEGVQGAVTSIGSKVFINATTPASSSSSASGAGAGGAGSSMGGGGMHSHGHHRGSVSAAPPSSAAAAAAAAASSSPSAGSSAVLTPSDALCQRLADYAAQQERELRRARDAVAAIVAGEQASAASLGDVAAIARAFARYERTQAQEGRGGEALIANSIALAGGATRPVTVGDDPVFGSPEIASVFDMLASAAEKVAYAGTANDPESSAAAAEAAASAEAADQSGAAASQSTRTMSAFFAKVGLRTSTAGTGADGSAATGTAPSGAALAALLLKEHLSEHAWFAAEVSAALARRQGAVDKLNSLVRECGDAEAKLAAKPGCSVPPQGAGPEWHGFASSAEPGIRALQIAVVALREAAEVQRKYVEAMSGELIKDVVRWRQVRRGESKKAVRAFAGAMAAAARARAAAWAELESKVNMIT